MLYTVTDHEGSHMYSRFHSFLLVVVHWNSMDKVDNLFLYIGWDVHTGHNHMLYKGHLAEWMFHHVYKLQTSKKAIYWSKLYITSKMKSTNIRYQILQ